MKTTLLMQAVKLEDRLAALHEAMSDKLGDTNKLALDCIYCYGIACGIVIDLERMAETVEDE